MGGARRTDESMLLWDVAGALGEPEWRVRRAAFHSIQERVASTVPELADATGLNEDAVEKAISKLVGAGMAVVDDGGRVVGSAGLSLVPGRHRLRLGGNDFFTWCAIDALGIPAALESDALAVTSCPTCGRAIEVEVRRGRLGVDPRLRAWLPRQECCSSVIDEACPDMNLFCTDEHLEVWRRERGAPDGIALSIPEVEELGRIWWGDLA